MFHSFNASSIVVTLYHSIAACKAQIGSTSVIITLAPYHLIDIAHHLPTSP